MKVTYTSLGVLFLRYRFLQLVTMKIVVVWDVIPTHR